MNGKKLIALVLILTFTFALPVSTWAVDVVPPIPVSDSIIRDKEAGLTIFGFTIPGLTWDSIAIAIAKVALEQILQATTDWVRNGFEGNPAYATDPTQFFTDIADNIAGEFIAGSDLAFLCSPFQTKIRLTLQRYYTQRRQFRCSLTDVVANIDAFYNDFSQGGWDGWFAMTQNGSNNPYGAYIEASLEMNSRLASAVGLKKEHLQINTGFLNTEKCPSGAEEIPDNLGGTNCFEVDQNGQRHLVSKQIVTPGALVKNQLDKALPSGMEKLITLEHVEQLISGVLNGLFYKYVLGSDGLFSRGSRSNPPPGIPPPVVEQPNPCDALRDLYGDDVECSPDGDPEPEEPGNPDNPDEVIIEQ